MIKRSRLFASIGAILFVSAMASPTGGFAAEGDAAEGSDGWGVTTALSDDAEATQQMGSFPEEAGEESTTNADSTERSLLTIASEISALVDPTEGAREVTADGENYGYAGLRVDHHTLTLFWVGEVPDNIARILDSAPPRSVFVVGATYTLFDMQVAARELIQSTDVTWPEGVSISMTGPRPEGDGVTLEYYTSNGLPIDKSAIQKSAARITDLKIFAEQVPGPHLSLSRQQDDSPYAGGDELGMDLLVQ